MNHDDLVKFCWEENNWMGTDNAHFMTGESRIAQVDHDLDFCTVQNTLLVTETTIAQVFHVPDFCTVPECQGMNSLIPNEMSSYG